MPFYVLMPKKPTGKCVIAAHGHMSGGKSAVARRLDIPEVAEKIADMGDLGALIALRPFLVETGTEDELNGERGIKNVSEQLDITREAYRLFAAEDSLEWFVFEGGHIWRGDKTYDFMENNLEKG